MLDNAAVSARTARRRKAESLAKGGTAGDIVQRPRAPQEGIRNLKKRTRETFRTLLVESSELAAHASKEVEAGDTDAMLRMLLSSGGRDSKLVTNIKDALPAHILDQLRKEGEDMFKARLREPTRVQEAMLKANMSHDSYEAFWSNLVPNEKGVKAGRSSIVEARHAVGDIMGVLNPLDETAGKAGYGHNVDRYFQFLLPAYFDRCARYMYADGDEEVTLIYPMDPNSMTEDELQATGDAVEQSEQVCTCGVF